MSNDKEKKTNSTSALKGSAIAAIVGIAAICFCVIFVIIRATGAGAYTETEDSKNGALYISSIEKRDYKELADRMGKTSEEEKKNNAEQKLEALDDEEQDIWSLFDGIVIVGDSRAESFVEYGFLPESVVVAKKGANLRYADEDISSVVSKQPDILVFSYGINDVTGNWDSADDFIARYKEILATYREELPNTDIFVCSIIPVYERAINDDPTLTELPKYASAVEEMCDEEGYIFLDCDDMYELSEYYERDGMHFVKDMYPIWADKILRKVFTYESGKSAENND